MAEVRFREKKLRGYEFKVEGLVEIRTDKINGTTYRIGKTGAL